MEVITLLLDNDTLARYELYYFSVHKKAKKRPIQHPYHESINVWMIMKRPMMNALKQRWKDFIVWFIEEQGYSNLRIDRCDLEFAAYYPNNRRHDVDNSCPKFILDGLCESGFLVDDDCMHVEKLTLQCGVDLEHPRTEIKVHVKEYADDREDQRRKSQYGEEGKAGVHHRGGRRDEGALSA